MRHDPGSTKLAQDYAKKTLNASVSVYKFLQKSDPHQVKINLQNKKANEK